MRRYVERALVTLAFLMGLTIPAGAQELSIWWAPIPGTAQEGFFDDDSPEAYLYFAGGYGAGKTTTLAAKALKLSNINAPLPILWTVPDFDHVHDTIIPTLTELDPKTDTPWFLRPDQFRYVASEHTLYWIGGGPILFASGKAPGSIKGPNVASCVVDEPGSISYIAWRNSVNRVRHPRAKLRQKCAAGTPEGFGWLMDAFGDEARPEHYKLYEMDTRENVELLQYVPDYLKQVMENATEAELVSYLGGKFGNLLGTLAYGPFDSKIHYRTGVEIDRGAPLRVCYDFNVDPLSCVVAQHAPGPYGPEVRVVHSVIRFGALTEDVTTEVAKRFSKWLPGYDIYGDATGKARSTLSKESNYDIIQRILRSTGAPVRMHVPQANPPVLLRLRSVNTLLKNARGHVRLVIAKHEPVRLCPNRDLVKSLQQTTLKPGTTEILKKPGETITHPGEALGYYIAKEFPAQDPSALLAAIKVGGTNAPRRHDDVAPAPYTEKELAALTRLVMQHGSAAVTAIRRQSDPSFELPDHLKGVTPGSGR